MTNPPIEIERLIDANLNRLKEGIRVIEDINRYLYNNTSITPKLKELRHQIQKAYSIENLKYRDIENDILTKSTKSELQRTSLDDVIIANFSRTQESARVLEEIYKLSSIELSELFKNIRYSLYGIEKEFFYNSSTTQQ